MKQTLLIYLLLGWCVIAAGQTGRLMGVVLDSENKVPLEIASVTISGPDSSFITYKLTDKYGRFLFERLPVKKKLLVNITYSGYKGNHTSVQLDAGRTDTLSVLMVLHQHTADAVVINTTVPVRMNGDTLEINPAGFKMKEDAVVEELLNQVPGITIWSDGTITVNGEKVRSVLVDGKPFMGSNDSRIATQNLPKAAIEKIQLYQEYDRSNIGHQARPQDSLLTMNIKLKEDSKKGYFGKAGGGIGTRDRFESDLSVQMYDKKSSLGIGGGLNNINKNIGNLQELFQNNTYRSSNPNLYNVGRFGTNGVNRNHSIGGAFTRNFIKTTNSRQNNRLTVNYNVFGTDGYVTELSLQNRTLVDLPQLISSKGIYNDLKDNQELGINYLRTNSYGDNLEISLGAITDDESNSSSQYTEIRDKAGLLLNTNDLSARQSQRSDKSYLIMRFARSDEEAPKKDLNMNIDVSHNSSLSDRTVRSAFRSNTDMSQDVTTNRLYTIDNQSYSVTGTLDYSGFKRLLLGRYNLFDIGIWFGNWFNYGLFKADADIRDYDSTYSKYFVNNKISNKNQKELHEYTPSLHFSRAFIKNSKVFNLQFKLLNDFKTEKNVSSIAERNLNRSFQFFRYEGSFSMSHRERVRIYSLIFSYAKNYTYSSVDQLHAIADDINVYEIRQGNPSLRNRINHNFRLNADLNIRNPKSIYSLYGNFSATYMRSFNPVVDSIINDLSGKRSAYYVNANKSGDLNIIYSFNVSRKLKTNSIQLVYSGYINIRSLPNYIDGIYNLSRSNSLGNQLKLQYAPGAKMVLNVEHGRHYYTTRQTAVRLTAFNNTSSTTRLGVNKNYLTHFSFGSTLDYIENSNLSRPTILWNAFATYRFMKQQGELKLSAMDLLNQYRNIINSVDAFGTITKVTNGLQQYFMLTFSYYPRKFGKTEIKKQPN